MSKSLEDELFGADNPEERDKSNHQAELKAREKEARLKVIEAVHHLVAEGLVARTWGNVSARIDEYHFIITPSGRDYGSMKPADLVKVAIEDCSYEGRVKPSSEKGIHADVYKQRQDINFVIHTHQFYASAVSAAGLDTQAAVCVPYGLPGTAALRHNVSGCVSLSSARAFLLERHGALCLGADMEDAFRMAHNLEESCKNLYECKVPADAEYTGKMKPYLDDYAQLVGNGKDSVPAEDAEAVKMVTAKNLAAALYASEAGPMGTFDAWLQRFVYKKKYSKLKNRK